MRIVLGGAVPAVETIALLARLVLAGVHWVVAGIGEHGFPMMAVTLALGGHIHPHLRSAGPGSPGTARG